MTGKTKIDVTPMIASVSQNSHLRGPANAPQTPVCNSSDQVLKRRPDVANSRTVDSSTRPKPRRTMLA